jgi:6-phosphogluconolactonase (cycloisomerase 2 family)
MYVDGLESVNKSTVIVNFSFSFNCLLVDSDLELKWSSCGNYLYSGGRKDNFIRCWDVRNTQQTLYTLPRLCSTNQRLHFDVDYQDNFLVSGNQV